MAAPRKTVWEKYVALGDSITEGLADFDNDGNPRGWADRLAQHLANHFGEPVQYANLAIRGRLLKPILDEQVGPALELKPDLVSIWGGGNDMLRPDADPDVMADQLEAAVKQFREAGTDVILPLGIDSKNSPLISLTRKRTAVFNAQVIGIAEKYDCKLLNIWSMKVLMDFRLWAADRIHLTSEGHERVANAALVALGLPPAMPDYNAPLPKEPEKTPRELVEWHGDWLLNHVGPWIGRRIHRTSSGAGRTCKQPDYCEVSPVSSHE